MLVLRLVKCAFRVGHGYLHCIENTQCNVLSRDKGRQPFKDRTRLLRSTKLWNDSDSATDDISRSRCFDLT